MATDRQSEHHSQTWRAFLIHEMVEYYINFVFLALFLVAFAWYRRLVLAAYHIQYSGYWMPLIEAAILAKVIMIGDAMRLGRRFQDRPLILVTIYRSIVFSLFVAVFMLCEHIVDALAHGKSASEGVVEIANKGMDELLGSCVMIFAAFLPFFAMKEIERVFGAEKVRRMFFRGTVDKADSLHNSGEAASAS